MIRKIGSVTHVGTCKLEGTGLRLVRTASAANQQSYYRDGARKIDIRAFLQSHAEKYAISANPADYVYEIIRANTTNVPNENNDAFHKSELLRFDTHLRRPVYATYVAKPHHLNHKADNPLAARGIIIDSHYNDYSAPLEFCPTEGCQTRTASRENRDETGIHCRKCGAVVKDEFVEILVGVDAAKDKWFAEGVRNGTLKSGSMGCNCLSTACNVCGHVAYSEEEFCNHIKAGNKGSYWLRSAAKKSAAAAADGAAPAYTWTRINKGELSELLSKRGYKLASSGDFCSVRIGDDFEVRRAYENCLGVIFDEYSRVKQPADPRALQTAVLEASLSRAASLHDAHPHHYLPSPDELRRETEALLRTALRAPAEASAEEPNLMARVAQTPPPEDDVPTGEAGGGPPMPPPGAPEGAPGAGAGASDAPETRLVGEGVDLTIPTGSEVRVTSDGVAVTFPDGRQEQVTLAAEQPGAPGVPAAPGATPGTPRAAPGEVMDSLQEASEDALPGAEKTTSVEMGLVPGASKDKQSRKSMSQRRRSSGMGQQHTAPVSRPTRASGSSQGPRPFEANYKHWTVRVTPAGNAAVMNGGGTPVFIVRAGRELPSGEDRRGFGKDVLGHVLDHGIVATAKKFKAVFSPKATSVVDGAMDDMAAYEDKALYGSVVENASDDLKGDIRGKPPTAIAGPGLGTDMRGDVRGKPPKSVDQNITLDREAGEVSPPASILSNAGSDMRGVDRGGVNLGHDDVLEGEMHDHKEPVAGGGGKKRKADSNSQAAERDLFAARLQRVHQSRVAALEEKHAAEKKALEDTLTARLGRAIYLVAHRQRLNLEPSRLKEAMFDVLTRTRKVGRDAATGEPLEFVGMSADLANFLVEAAFETDDGVTIETTVNKAASLMQKGDEYLLDAEKDLTSFQPAQIAITAAWQLGDGERAESYTAEADELRRQASAGNLVISPASEASDPGANGNGHDKRAAIRSALGGTKVASARVTARN